MGSPDGVVAEVVVSRNVADSAKLYEIDPRAMLAASRRCEELNLEIIGVFHSHTHSDAYPSPTDVAQAPDPTWHYVLVSLRLVPSALRSYLIVNSTITEEVVQISK